MKHISESNPGFIEFSLNKTWKVRAGGRYDWDLPVICFAGQRFTSDALCIPNREGMPPTWLNGYRWRDLNIMPEAFIEDSGCSTRFGFSYPKEDRVHENLNRLYSFIHAFGFKTGASMYMHIWHSRLPKISS